MLDLNHRARPGSVTALVNAQIEGLAPIPQERRDYIGASAIGDACERRLQYKYVGVPPDRPEFDNRTLRIFARGHWGETQAIEDMTRAGFLIKTRAKDGGQIGFSAAGGRFAGHCDGVIVEAPLAMRLPCVWEHKMLGDKGWNKVSREGVASAYPHYAAQIAIYQAYLDLPNPALLTATNADTMERYHELVEFDAELAQRSSDKAARIIKATEAQELLPRVAASSDFYVCRWCAWSGTCWGSK